MLDEQDPDFVCVTECRSSRGKFKRVMSAKIELHERGYIYSAVHAGSNAGYAGCAVFSKIPFNFVTYGLETPNAPKEHTAMLKKLEGEARVLTVEFANFSVVTCYSPNSGNDQDLCRLPKRLAFETLLSYFLSRLDHPYILVGDLNVVRNVEDAEDTLDHERYAIHPGCSDEERGALESLLKDRKLFDLQEESGVEGFTFHRGNPDPRGCRYKLRLDYVLPHVSLRNHVSNFRIIRGCLSDHYGLLFDVDQSLFRAKPSTILEGIAHIEEETTDTTVSNNLRDVLRGTDKPVLSGPFNTHTTADDVEQNLELCSSLSEYIELSSVLAMDPDHTGYISCADLSSLLSKGEDDLDSWGADPKVKSTHNGRLDSYECISSVEYATAPRKAAMIKLNLDVVNCYIDYDVEQDTGAQQHGLTTRFGGIGDSGCSTSCASYRAICARFGKATVDAALYKDGYNAVFKVADNQTTASLGQLRLTFKINEVQFTHVFYVLPELSHDFILGNNFLVQANAVIDYRKGSLTLTCENGLEQTQVHFGVEEISSLTNDLSSSPQRESVLFNSQAVDIEPGTSRYVHVAPLSTDDVCTTRPFGVIGPHFARNEVQTPYGVMQLDCSTNHIWLSNFSDDTVQIRKGTPVATFVELPRSTVDLYAANLNTMELYNLPPVPECLQECSCCPLESGDSPSLVRNTTTGPTFKRGQPPRDPFVPFEGKDDEHLSHHPRLTYEEIEALSEEELTSLFTDTFLKDTSIGKQLTEVQHYQMKMLLLLNRDVFGKNACPGSANHEGVRIPTGDALPAGFPLRPTLPPLRPIIDQHIDLMLKHNIIEPSNSPWSAAVLLVPKKGGEWRFAVDYRRLNSLTVRDSYPLPRISDALASLSGNQYFSACDALAGFHNLPMAEEDKCKTAFRCHRGSFQFNRLPFGLVNAPAAFQRYMDVALSGINFNCALIYLDDILIFSKTWDDHMRDCNAVFDCVRKAGLHLKLKKCTFGADRVKYLGHVVGPDGVRPCEEKTAVVDSFCLDKLDPKTARPRLRSWLGLAGYYQKYIPRFARITKPIHDFLKSRKPFKGPTTALRTSVQLIKEALTSSPILAHPDFDLPFAKSIATHHPSRSVPRSLRRTNSVNALSCTSVVH
jgi:exonuclease III